MKVKQNNKVYEYDYKTIFMKGDLHREIKQLAAYEGRSMSGMVKYMMEYYKRFS